MITDSFDDKTAAVLTLDKFYGERQNLIDVCLITFSGVIANALLKEYNCRVLATIRAVNGDRHVYKFNYKGKDIAFLLSPIGSANAAQYVIETNWLAGASKFIMFGSAGSLDSEKTTGKFVVPTQSYRDEGASYHYAPPADYITVKNADKVAEFFKEMNLPYVKGRVWTTDAMLRETVANAKKRRDEGCIAVEMEVAGVQAACDFYGFELYDFLVTGDVLYADGNYERGGLSDANHNVDKVKVALELALKI